jgi:hypothetical protein
MAITEVTTDFTYFYDTIVEPTVEGAMPNPSDQDAYDIDDSNASSVLSVGMGNQLATAPLLTGGLSIFELGLEGGFQTDSGGSLNKDVVQLRMEGSLIVVPTGSLSKNVLQVQMQGTMYRTRVIKGDASVVEVQIEASGFTSNNLSMDKEAVILSMTGYMVQGQDEGGGIIVIPADDDVEYPYISGEEYIVVNLRTKAHSTYRDGERTAVAKTGAMNFGSYTDKSISDMYVLSRARGESEVVMTSGENVERRYPLTFGDTTPPNLKNKKRTLAKGLKATNWSVAIVVADESHLEVRGLELLVTDIKRHT